MIFKIFPLYVFTTFFEIVQTECMWQCYQCLAVKKDQLFASKMPTNEFVGTCERQEIKKLKNMMQSCDLYLVLF